jgi:hypothetical protein
MGYIASNETEEKLWMVGKLRSGPGLCGSNIAAPITVAARSKAGNVFIRSNAGIVGSIPTQGMDVCLRLCCSV